MQRETENKNVIKHWKNFASDVFWLFKIVWKKYRLVLTLSFFTSTCIALISLFQAYSNGVLVNTIINYVDKTIDKKVVLFSLILVGFSLILPSFLYLLQNFFEKQVYFFLSKHFDLMMIEKRIYLDIQQYEDTEFNNFVNRVNEKSFHVISNLLTNLFYDYQSLITIIFSSIIIARQSIFVFIIIFLASLPELIISTRYGERGWYIWGNNINGEERRKYWSIKGFTEHIPSLVEIKLFNLGKNFIDRVSSFISSVEEKQNTNEKKYLIQQLITTLLSQGTLLLTVVFFTREAIYGNIEAGTVIFLFGGMVGFQNSINALFSSIGRKQEDRLYIHDLSTFFKTKQKIKDGSIELKNEKSPEIFFKNVTFAYPETQKNIYESLSLKIKSGEKLAIVGLNGAGKTTLIKLLCRFYDPQRGEVLIDGVNLKDIKINTWYRNLGILFQDFAKFDFPKIGELISFGDINDKYDFNRVIESAKNADAGFIEKLKDGFEQQLGKSFRNGIEPSGGQWQKLGLSRLFYRNPMVWVLDEPTSSIDSDAESKIFESLSKLPKEKTVILISHRFSTVRTADRIIVLDEGRVREDGTHEELIKLNGEYARLFNLQAEGYK
jgi:ABC-type multidrug transport system fused ATPase/permease subunit